MSLNRYLRVIMMLVAGLVLFAAVSYQPQAVEAQANLLANPGFEGAYADYVPNPPIPQCASGVCTTAQMPSGWLPWWVPQEEGGEGWINRMPEWKRAEAPFLNRVHSGESAMQYFTFHSTHTAGSYQFVNVPNNAKVRFSAWGQAWSSATDATYSDFPTTMNMRIGIDPTGGGSPFSPNVVWSNVSNPYDQWEYFQVETTARGSKVSVWFYSAPVEPRKHNDVYWDTSSLTVLSTPPTATPTRRPATATPTRPPATATPNWPTATPFPTATPLPTGPWFTATPDVTAATNTPEPAQIAAAAGQAPAVSFVLAPTATPNADGVIYAQVPPGGSIWSVAARSGLTLDEILALNPSLTEGSFVSTGDQLVIGLASPTGGSDAEAGAGDDGAAAGGDDGAAAEAEQVPPTATAEAVAEVPEVVESKICLTAFTDANRSGNFDGGEPLLPSVAITISNESGVVSNYVTNGIAEPYCISGLEPGTYNVTRSQTAKEVLTTDGDWTIALTEGATVDISYGSYEDEDVVAASMADDVVDAAAEAASSAADAASDAASDAVDTVTEAAEEASSGIDSSLLIAVVVAAVLTLIAVLIIILSRRST